MRLFAKKSLGQHFLNSPGVLRKIIDAATLTTGETVLEIGPGTGVLTRALLDAGARVIAVEKDARAIAMLEQTFFKECSSDQLTIIEGDILDPALFNSSPSLTPQDNTTQASVSTPDSLRIKKLAQLSTLKNGNFSLIANIPYYITGAILEKFLEHGPRPDRIVILVQKEVAERIVARDGKESILSVSVKAFGIPKLVAVVPPGAFTPPPTVDSAILSITDISTQKFNLRELDQGSHPGQNSADDAKIDIQHFFKIVKAGFAHKRKFALRNIESLIDSNTVLTREKLESAWKDSNLDPKVRAEDMTVGQWMEMTRKLSTNQENQAN
jgi:16S rRNA (adenine1518-N6/adenine1519-N6)-dimethyltransferase